MTRIAFIGLGNMGGGMAARQVVGGREVAAFDLNEAAIAKVVATGATGAKSIAEAVEGADAVITMLPAGPHVRKVYADDIFPNAPASALLIDCSTIDVDSARAVATQARAAGFRFADAPVSGGTAAADAGTLAFMVGCDEADFYRVEETLKPMSRVTIRAGDHGAGQAAKICNNMLLGISMIGVGEAFVLARKLGLSDQALFDVASTSSGQCWSLNTYCPVPGPVPTSPANRDYAPGFAADLMLKDLKLSQQAAQGSGAVTPLGAAAAQLYELFAAQGHGGLDFSAIVTFLNGTPGKAPQ